MPLNADLGRHRAGLIPPALLLPAPALAHAPGSVEHWWTPDPWAVIPGLLIAAMYTLGTIRLQRRGRPPRAIGSWHVGAFCAGMAALFVALIWPLEAMSGFSLAAHMAQHMLLIVVAPPLLVLARPMLAALLALPRRWRARVTAALRNRLARGLTLAGRPAAAFMVHGVVVWAWHAPAAYEAAVHSEPIHVLEHGMFFGSALIFWHSVTAPPDGASLGYPTAALWTLGTLMHTGLLGAILTFAPVLLYPSYSVPSEPAGLTALQDQQLAGLIMWIPGGAIYTVAAVALIAVWLRSRVASDQEALRSA